MNLKSLFLLILKHKKVLLSKMKPLKIKMKLENSIPLGESILAQNKHLTEEQPNF